MALPQLPIFKDEDSIRMLKDELIRYPNSCLSKNLRAWYSALYSAGTNDTSCSYQVEINEELCPSSEPSDIDEAVDLLVALIAGDTRAIARQTLRIICRRALRRSTQFLAPEP